MGSLMPEFGSGILGSSLNPPAHSTLSGKPHSRGLPSKAVGPWLTSEPTCGISPARSFPRRSRLTATGMPPYSGGIPPVKWL